MARKHSAEPILSRVRNNPRILKANKKALEDLVAYMQANGIKQTTIAKNVYCMEKFINAIDPKVNLVKAERQDIERAVAKIVSSDLSEETKRAIRVVIKSFYKHFIGEDLYYPKQIAWIKTTVNKNRKFLPEDILNEEDIAKLLDAAPNPRDRAVIALLFDSGMRAGELLSLRRKDVELEGKTGHVTVMGKTGARRIPILFSVPFIGQWLDMKKELSGSAPLWVSIGSWSNKNQAMDYSGLRMMLKKLTLKAKIDKRVYPHLFRHSRASNYANMLTEQQLKAYFGWTGDSKMTATYVHLSGRDIDNAILKANNMQPKEEAQEQKLAYRPCPKCREINGIASRFCTRCGGAMDVAIGLKEEALDEAARRGVAKGIEDPSVVERALEKVVEGIRKKRNRKEIVR